MSKAGRALGYDSAQALYFAMQQVAVQLYLSEPHRLGNLYWTEAGKGYGFPLPFGGRDAAVGDDRRL